MTYRVLFISFIAFILSACSSKPPGPTTPPPTSIAAIEKWETSGRVGIRTSDDAISGNFNWQTDPTTFSLKIVGPFGQGATKLDQTKDGTVTLAYKDTKVQGDNAAILLQQELGWEFPVEQVTYWIRGLAAPVNPLTPLVQKAQVITDSKTNLPKTIEQDGWTVTYSSFTDVEGLSLPRKMQVSKPPFRVNLIINQWTIQ